MCFTFSYSLFSISLRGKEYEGGLLSYSQVLFQRVGSSSEATRRESSVHVCITVTAVKSAFFSLCVQSHNHVSKVYLLFTDIFFALGQRRGLVGLLSCLLASSRFSTLHSHVRVTSCVRGKVDSFILCVCVCCWLFCIWGGQKVLPALRMCAWAAVYHGPPGSLPLHSSFAYSVDPQSCLVFMRVFVCWFFFFLFDLLPGEQTLDVRDKSCSYSKQIEEGDMKIWKIGHGPKIMKKILRKYRLLQGTEIWMNERECFLSLHGNKWLKHKASKQTRQLKPISKHYSQSRTKRQKEELNKKRMEQAVEKSACLPACTTALLWLCLYLSIHT